LKQDAQADLKLLEFNAHRIIEGFNPPSGGVPTP
jgi:hypothetical protein